MKALTVSKTTYKNGEEFLLKTEIEAESIADMIDALSNAIQHYTRLLKDNA